MTGIDTSHPVKEKWAVVSLASLYAFRMLGLFMVLPVMMLEGSHLEGATPQLLGLAMGIYGLSQALLQIPAGALSDRIGRKPVIIGGLLIFAAGSLLAASADSVWGVVAGRALQGCGAIASAIMALVTDITREENRMKAMATIGASIGLSFSAALIIGPALAAAGGLTAIFGITAVLALVGIGIVMTLPTPPQRQHRDASAALPEIISQLKNPAMWPLITGVFLLHALMVVIFSAVPGQLAAAGLAVEQHSLLYLPVLIASFVLMVPLIIVAEKKQQMKRIVATGALLLAGSLLLMGGAHVLWQWITLLVLYFWGFNLLEASLPSWLSKIAPAGSRGSAMGIFSTFQFAGAFTGGICGGWLLSHASPGFVFVVPGAIMVLWWFMVLRAEAPQHLTSVRLNAGPQTGSDVTAQLQQLPGVAEVLYIPSEQAIYLKVSAGSFDREAALTIIGPTGEEHGAQCQ